MEESLSQNLSQYSITNLGQQPQDEQEPETTPLHYACGIGDIQTLYQYLQPGIVEQIDLDGHDGYGRTALIYTISSEQVECLEALLAAGANVNAPDKDGRTALHWAAFHGKHKIIKTLLGYGAACEARDLEGRLPLHLSTGAESSKGTKLLVKAMNREDIDAVDNEQMTALHWSAFHDHVKHMDVLIEAGATLVVRDVEGKTPLHWTSNNKTSKSANTYLVSAFETLNMADNEGRTALHLAVAERNAVIVDYLAGIEGREIVTDNTKRTPLHWAVLLGFEDITHILLEHDVDYSIPDGSGATALHYATQNDSLDCLCAMLEFEHVVDLADHEGRTALMWAAAKGNAEAIVTMLERSGFDVHASDSTGGSSLHISSYAGHTTCVDALLKHGASVDTLDTQNQSALFRACEMGHSDVVELLIGVGANVNLVDKEGRTPLHWGALGGHNHICSLLIKAKATIDAPDLEGRTPLQCSTYGSHVPCVAVLLDNSADPNIQDKEGITALHWAASMGSLEAVKMLFDHGAYANPMEIDKEKLTPLDYAVIGDGNGNSRDEVVEYLVEKGALSVTTIKEIAAITIQSWLRGRFARRAYLVMKLQAASREAEKPVSPPPPPHVPVEKVPSKPEVVSRQASKASVVVSRQPSQTKVPSKPSTPPPQSENNSAPLMPSLSKVRIEEEDRLRKEREQKEKEDAIHRKQKEEEAALQKAKDPAFLLQRSQDAKSLAKKERHRIHIIRRKIQAAIVIQRAFRKFCVYKRANGGRSLSYARKSRTSKPMLSDRANHSPVNMPKTEEWQRQIAALTIQLAYRQYCRKKLLKSLAKTSKKKVINPWASSVLAQQQRTRVAKIYKQPVVLHMYRPPRPKPMNRPLYYQYSPSPAVTSFHFALGSYYPTTFVPGSTMSSTTSRQQNYSTSRGYGTQSRRPQITSADSRERLHGIPPSTSSSTSSRKGYMSKTQNTTKPGSGQRVTSTPNSNQVRYQSRGLPSPRKGSTPSSPNKPPSSSTTRLSRSQIGVHS